MLLNELLEIALIRYCLDVVDQLKNVIIKMIVTSYKVDFSLFRSQIVIFRSISGLALAFANEKLVLSD